ncbi:MAG TPA: hypothetical protein VK213_09765 [Bacteroidales bacterium]|nr:hypothetical protein [Bacteroidales bacterium]
MKNYTLFILLAGILLYTACSQDKDSENFKILTGHIWTSDSLLVEGHDASTPGGVLANFKGDVKFNDDGTGSFGNYTGTWRFAFNETQLIITSPDLPIPLTTRIVELKDNSLKVTTSIPDPQNPLASLNIRMTFKPK